MLVEDDEIILSVYSSFLKEQGMEVVTALNGLDALEILRRDEFDLLITDVAMPKMSGIELIRRSREFQPNLPSIIVSGHATLKEAAEAINLKVFHYLAKPIRDLNELKEVSLEAIEFYRAKNTKAPLKTDTSRDVFRKVMIDTYLKPRFGLSVTGLAHNINSPLGGVMGYAQLAGMKHPDIKGLDMIVDQAQKVAGLLHRVAEKGHSDNNRNITDVNLHDLCENEEKFLDFNLYFKHNVEVVRNYDEIPAVKGIYALLAQIFNQLVQNAVDAVFESPEKKLTISLQRLDNSIVWTFEDSGEGIPAVNLDKIFEPGFTTRPLPEEIEDAEKPCGYGMGLYVVREIVKEMDGSIEIESEIEKGTKVIVKLPLET